MAYDLIDAVIGLFADAPSQPGARTLIYIGAESPIVWPEAWVKPSKEYLAAAAEASAKYEVPIENIFAITRKESSRFSPKAKGRNLLNSYERVRDMVIPGSGGVTWGQRYKPEEWHAYGIMQVLPFNIFGVAGIAKGTAAKGLAYDTRTNVLAGTKYLRGLFDKLGNWEDAIWKYNGSKGYMREVLAFRDEYRTAQGVA